MTWTAWQICNPCCEVEEEGCITLSRFYDTSLNEGDPTSVVFFADIVGSPSFIIDRPFGVFGSVLESMDNTFIYSSGPEFEGFKIDLLLSESDTRPARPDEPGLLFHLPISFTFTDLINGTNIFEFVEEPDQSNFDISGDDFEVIGFFGHWTKTSPGCPDSINFFST